MGRVCTSIRMTACDKDGVSIFHDAFDSAAQYCSLSTLCWRVIGSELTQMTPLDVAGTVWICLVNCHFNTLGVKALYGSIDAIATPGSALDEQHAELRMDGEVAPK